MAGIQRCVSRSDSSCCSQPPNSPPPCSPARLTVGLRVLVSCFLFVSFCCPLLPCFPSSFLGLFQVPSIASSTTAAASQASFVIFLSRNSIECLFQSCLKSHCAPSEKANWRAKETCSSHREPPAKVVKETCEAVSLSVFAVVCPALGVAGTAHPPFSASLHQSQLGSRDVCGVTVSLSTKGGSCSRPKRTLSGMAVATGRTAGVSV